MNIILMTQKMRLMKKKYPDSENFFGGGKENFVHACNFLSLNKDNN